MATKVKVYHNGDDVFIAWKPDGFISGCRGFALLRRRNGVEEIVSTWVGFVGQTHERVNGGLRPTGRSRNTNGPTTWPTLGTSCSIACCRWWARTKDNLQPDPDMASEWTEEISLAHELAPKIEAYFNRGIVAAQWVSRRLGVTDARSEDQEASHDHSDSWRPLPQLPFRAAGRPAA